ncbi:MAG TPA: hypothetical protein DIT46_02990, partial [Gemmatimonadetes bacterium]|nr:hypothetical protein [Gemmatimonadota bacterium]
MVFLSGSAYSVQAARVYQRIRHIEDLTCAAIVNEITGKRILQAGARSVVGRILTESGRHGETKDPTRCGISSLRGIPEIQIHTVSSIGSNESVDLLRKLDASVCVNTGGCGILRADFLKQAGMGVLNCHSG